MAAESQLAQRKRAPGGVRARTGRRRLTVAVLASTTLVGFAIIGPAVPGAPLAGPFLTDTQAAFTDSDAGTGTFQAMTVVAPQNPTCVTNGDGTITLNWAYPNGTPTQFDILLGATGSTVLTSVTGGATTVTLSGRALLALGTVQVRIRTNVAPSWPMPTTANIPVTVLSLVGLGGARCGT